MKYPSKQKLINLAMELEMNYGLDDAREFVIEAIEYGYISPKKWKIKELKAFYKEYLSDGGTPIK